MAKPVYIQDRNSGLVLEYQVDAPYDVVINKKQDGNAFQQWYITSSGVEGYVYVESAGQQNSVVSASVEKQKPLYVSTKVTSTLELSQLWILREPSDGTNQRFILMSAASGYVMNVKGASKDPGTYIQTYDRTNDNNEQFTFHSWVAYETDSNQL